MFPPFLLKNTLVLYFILYFIRLNDSSVYCTVKIMPLYSILTHVSHLHISLLSFQIPFKPVFLVISSPFQIRPFILPARFQSCASIIFQLPLIAVVPLFQLYSRQGDRQAGWKDSCLHSRQVD